MENVIRPGLDDELYFTGDFINKGPDSKEVLDYVMRMRDKGYRIYSVRGNHEQMLLDAIEDHLKVDDFIQRGGLETLESFGINDVNEIPDHYTQFMAGLPFYIELENYFIVHAGFDFSSSNPFENREAMLNIKGFEPDPGKLNYKKVIHGHFARPLQEILLSLTEYDGFDINIDNGCVYTHREGMGNMIILNLEDLSYHVQPCLDEHNYEDTVSKRRHYQSGS